MNLRIAPPYFLWSLQVHVYRIIVQSFHEMILLSGFVFWISNWTKWFEEFFSLFYTSPPTPSYHPHWSYHF